MQKFMFYSARIVGLFTFLVRECACVCRWGGLARG